jgi:hypothetical protein
MLQPRKRGSERPQDQFGAEAIVQSGRMDHDFEHEAFGVHQQVPFAPGNFLGAIKAMRATCSVVLTVWLSTMAWLARLRHPCSLHPHLEGQPRYV